jgi:purine-binding chemotaxis protein CheW
MSKVLQLVGFKTGSEYFGVPIGKVKEIVRVPEITAVPDTPDFLNGVINLRGRIIPVIELNKRLCATGTDRKKSNRILVLELEGSIVGLLVDSASEILKVSEDSIEPPPGLISAIGAEYVTGVGKLKDKLIVLLDVARLLSPEEMKKVETAGSRSGPAEEERRDECGGAQAV